MKNYIASVQDKEWNVLLTFDITAKNLKEARKQLNVYKANCKINDAKHFNILFH